MVHVIIRTACCKLYLVKEDSCTFSILEIDTISHFSCAKVLRHLRKQNEENKSLALIVIRTCDLRIQGAMLNHRSSLLLPNAV